MNKERVYINGIIPLYTPELGDELELDNWCVISYDSWNEAIKNKNSIEGRLLYKDDLFHIKANTNFKIGYDEEKDEFLFFTDQESSDLYRWQSNGLITKEIKSLFSSFYHNLEDEDTRDLYTYDIKEAVEFLLDNQGISYVHALLNDEIIFQLIDSSGLEKPSSKIIGIGIDIPIDTTDTITEYKILNFSRLSTFDVHYIEGIKLYQYDYVDDMGKLDKDVRDIVTEVYGATPSEVKYRLNFMTKLKL
ncbi:hypothetical protein [Lewinella sp. 4G2]|uniref:hypothetical protein n=1 Tax=Lewinella sp. 4G2 TaxID=1803372 RepID=UPI0007E007A1|nr:hypothetical protein [Lewinella sp. 4G2]OAV45109.1 hypothetical protein A3850_011685 [Lewinella sp. 4G2]